MTDSKQPKDPSEKTADQGAREPALDIQTIRDLDLDKEQSEQVKGSSLINCQTR